MTQAISEREAGRVVVRLGLFTRRGWPPDKAQAFADRLTTRDRERDDRRACIECSNLQRKGGCFIAQEGKLHRITRTYTPITDILQRCNAFAWAK